MRPPVYDVYQMKVEHLPEGVKAAWLRTLPGERPDVDRWLLVGRERHPSRSTIAEMNKYGLCYRELASWIVNAKESAGQLDQQHDNRKAASSGGLFDS